MKEVLEELKAEAAAAGGGKEVRDRILDCGPDFIIVPILFVVCIGKQIRIMKYIVVSTLCIAQGGGGGRGWQGGASSCVVKYIRIY